MTGPSAAVTPLVNDEELAVPVSGVDRVRRRSVVRSQMGFYVVVHVLAVLALFFPTRWGIGPVLLMYALTVGSISLGFHRLLCHRSYRAIGPLRGALTLFGTLALQGGPISWVAVHRAHHAHTDGEGDPHGAHLGFWWSHLAWTWHKGPNGFRFKHLAERTPDLANDRFVVFCERHYLLINAVAMALCAVLLGPVDALWIFPLRIVVGWHCTFLVNSHAHSTRLAMAGQPSARNVPWLSLLTFGEGYHRNHHAHPASADFRRRWYDLDIGYALLRLLSLFKLLQFRRNHAI